MCRKKKIRPQNPVEVEDRVQIHKWKKDCSITRIQAQAWACKNNRTAQRYGLSKKHSREWFKRWWNYEPKDDVTSNHIVYTKRTGKSGWQKYNKEFKIMHIKRFVNANNIAQVSRVEYCRQNGLSNASLGRWLKKFTDIKPYEYRRVCYLSIHCYLRI